MQHVGRLAPTPAALSRWGRCAGPHQNVPRAPEGARRAEVCSRSRRDSTERSRAIALRSRERPSVSGVLYL